MNKQSPRDHIESRFTAIQIRQMYGICRAGRTKRHDFADLPTHFRQEAGQVDIEQAVDFLASHWEQFNK